jgi:hypothetical protein
MPIGKKVAERIVTQLKRYQNVLTAAKARDVNESDTVVIITDMMCDVFGYKKYEEITTEFLIKGARVDLAVKVGADVRFLIEAKAIGVELKDGHIRQAVDYGANKGVEWIVLTNGHLWRLYRIHFRQPIDQTLVFEFDLLTTNYKNDRLIECFGNLTRECFTTSSISEFFAEQQAVSKYSLAAALLSDPVLASVRREIKKMAPRLKIEDDELRSRFQDEIIKRDILESDEGKAAIADMRKSQKASEREKNKDRPASPPGDAPQDGQAATAGSDSANPIPG